MKKDLSPYLSRALLKLDQWTAQIKKSSPLTEESERLLLLKELVKEQIPNEDTRPAARQVR
ncbi:MAG TPA: hypothetical protein VFV50_18760 [Bdellovibrionales bacterium]|nr:hypothetical protein [Bdellovibrionales bacterium]